VENSQELAGQPASTPETIMDSGDYEVEWLTELMAPGVPTRSEVDVRRECLKVGDLKNVEALFLIGLEDCSDREVTIKDGQVAATMRCDMEAEPGSDAGFDVRGTYDRTSAHLTADANRPGGTVRMTRTMKRVSDC
jgi:hypothetical protein